MNASSRKANSVTGYQLTFFTQQDHRYHGKSLGQWLVEEARAMGIGEATLIAASEGFGHHGPLHAMHLFNLSEPRAAGHAAHRRHIVRLSASWVDNRYSPTLGEHTKEFRRELFKSPESVMALSTCRQSRCNGPMNT